MGTHHQKQHILHPFRGSYANARRRAHHGPPCIRASKFPTHTPRKRAATVVPDDMAFDVNARRTQRIWFSRATEMRMCSGWTVSALAFASAPGRPSGFHRRTQRTGLSTSWGLASTVVCSSIAGVTASQGVSEYERARDAAVGLQWTLISGLCGRGAYLPLSPREEHC